MVLRNATELHFLKRLIVGGMERVYEIDSTKEWMQPTTPEFTST